MTDALRRYPVLTSAFVLALAAALWLLVEVATELLGWSGRGPEVLAPWMTIGYVGRTHELDPRLIDATAGFPTPEEAGHPLTLAEIAQRRDVPIEEVYAEVDRVLRDLRHEHGHDNQGGSSGGDGSGSDAAPGDAATGKTAGGPSE